MRGCPGLGAPAGLSSGNSSGGPGLSPPSSPCGNRLPLPPLCHELFVWWQLPAGCPSWRGCTLGPTACLAGMGGTGRCQGTVRPPRGSAPRCHLTVSRPLFPGRAKQPGSCSRATGGTGFWEPRPLKILVRGQIPRCRCWAGWQRGPGRKAGSDPPLSLGSGGGLGSVRQVGAGG